MLTLVVLAGGLGSRFDRRDGTAKALATVGPAGERIVDYSVFDAARVGFRRVVLVCGADVSERASAEIEKLVAPWRRHRLEVVQHAQERPSWRRKPWCQR